MQEKRLHFSVFWPFFFGFCKTDFSGSLRRRGSGRCAQKCGYWFSKDLSLLYHKQPTESTLFCNFFFTNCELGSLHEQPVRNPKYFSYFRQFDISGRISCGSFLQNPRIFPSLPALRQRTFVRRGVFQAKPGIILACFRPLRLQLCRLHPAFCRFSPFILHFFSRIQQKYYIKELPIK